MQAVTNRPKVVNINVQGKSINDVFCTHSTLCDHSYKKAYVDSGNGDVENYRFVVVGQGPRRKVIKLRKQNSLPQQNQ